MCGVERKVRSLSAGLRSGHDRVDLAAQGGELSTDKGRGGGEGDRGRGGELEVLPFTGNGPEMNENRKPQIFQPIFWTGNCGRNRICN